jgi:hypothetical protein
LQQYNKSFHVLRRGAFAVLQDDYLKPLYTIERSHLKTEGLGSIGGKAVDDRDANARTHKIIGVGAERNGNRHIRLLSCRMERPRNKLTYSARTGERDEWMTAQIARRNRFRLA